MHARHSDRLPTAFLGVYEANDDAQAAQTSAAATRDRLLAWPTLQWARAQAQTGHSKVFYYYFAHHPPAPPEERFVENLGKDLGAYHGAELAYVFGNFVPPEWPWTETDRAACSDHLPVLGELRDERRSERIRIAAMAGVRSERELGALYR